MVLLSKKYLLNIAHKKDSMEIVQTIMTEQAEILLINLNQVNYGPQNLQILKSYM